MLSALAGMAFGLSLIVAVGAQNIFVLRQGLRREHVGLVAGICAVSDFVLISAGVGGLGTLIQSAPLVVDDRALGGRRRRAGLRRHGRAPRVARASRWSWAGTA